MPDVIERTDFNLEASLDREVICDAPCCGQPAAVRARNSLPYRCWCHHIMHHLCDVILWVRSLR